MRYADHRWVLEWAVDWLLVTDGDGRGLATAATLNELDSQMQVIIM
jgi:hypothetical protein